MKRPLFRPHAVAGTYWGRNGRILSVHIWRGTYARLTVAWRLLRWSGSLNVGAPE